MSRELAELLKAKMAAARKTKGGRDPDDKVLTDVLEDMLKPGPGHPPKTKAGQPDREAYEAAKRELEDTLAKLLAEQGAKVELEGLNSERSEEHTSELQSLMRISYAVFCLNKQRIQRQQIGRNILTTIIT